ncbi:MAG TPA: LysR family transcriptional regulator [Tardiphaga sp.]
MWHIALCCRRQSRNRTWRYNANVTQAASRLKIQQPAISHDLATLRVLMRDDLSVRVGRVMQPTPRAHALSGPGSQMLAHAH